MTTILITGGSRGLGAAIVQAYLDDGANVATCSRTPTPDTDRPGHSIAGFRIALSLSRRSTCAIARPWTTSCPR